MGWNYFWKKIQILKPDHSTKKNILIFVVLKDLTSYFPKSPNIEQSLLESFQPAKCKIEGKKGENVYFFDYFSRSVSVCKKVGNFELVRLYVQDS